MPNRAPIQIRPDGVAVISLGAADGRLERPTRDALAEALRSAKGDSFVRAIVLVSSHSEIFLTTDKHQLRDLTMRGDALDEATSRHGLAELFSKGEKPIVAAIHGRASGLGFEIPLSCAGRVVSDDRRTVLELSDVALGIAPSFHGLCRLADLLGYEAALRLSIVGTPIDARGAALLGLASACVPRAELLECAARLACKLALTPPSSPKKSPSDSLFRTTGLGKRVFMARAKRAVVEELGRDAAAAAQMIAILEAYAKGGTKASSVVEREAFASLVIASGCKRRIDVAFAIDELLYDNARHRSQVESDGLSSAESVLEGHPPSLDSIALEALDRPSFSGIAEVLVASDTDPKTVSRSIAAIHSPAKPIIVVHGEPLGFLRRIACIYINEACWLISKGSTIQHVDRALVEWGFPLGPLALCDSLGARQIADDCRALESRFGSRFVPAPFLQSLTESGRDGESRLYRGARASKEGRSWRRLFDAPRFSRAQGRSEIEGAVLERLGLPFPDASAPPVVAREEAQMRCALVLVNEALYCLGEKVIASARDGNVASVLGLGFPAFRGGVFGYVDTLGPRELTARLEAFSRHVGDRFAPAPLLKELGAAECFA